MGQVSPDFQRTIEFFAYDHVRAMLRHRIIAGMIRHGVEPDERTIVATFDALLPRVRPVLTAAGDPDLTFGDPPRPLDWIIDEMSISLT